MSGDELSDDFSLEAVVTQPGVNSDKDDNHRVDGESGYSMDLLGELMPEGEHYTLNSKRLKTHRVQQIAEALGIHQGNSVAEKREMIISKLDEMGYEAQSVQVVIQGRGDDAPMFLVNDNGIIKTVDSKVIRRADDGTGPNTELRSALRESRQETEQLQVELNDKLAEIKQLSLELESARDTIAERDRELTVLKEALDREKTKARHYWREQCDELARHEDELEAKDIEISLLKAKLLASPKSSVNDKSSQSGIAADLPLRTTHPPSANLLYEIAPAHRELQTSPGVRHGKAPPVDTYAGEGADMLFEEWLPSFERVAAWYGWSENEKLIQLAGHLKGKAQQEWSLLSLSLRDQYSSATVAIRDKLDPSRKALAVQDFRHLAQTRQESVSDFILRLEQTFRRAYGYEKVGEETRQALLHAQLQEGLRFTIMEAPAVSGAQSYPELCLAAKNEERRQTELAKRQQYARNSLQSPNSNYIRGRASTHDYLNPKPPTRLTTQRKCYVCGSPNHLANRCDSRKQESQGLKRQDGSNSSARPTQTGTTQPRRASMVVGGKDAHVESSSVTAGRSASQEETQNPLDLLYSSESDDGEVLTVRLSDRGSKAQSVRLLVQDVPAIGIIDTAADITIMGGKLFQKVASVAKLKKKNFKPPGITPHTYDQKPFKLDGRMELDVEFNDRKMKTTIYIKMNAHDQLLLSEGVCRQLGIVQYHPDVHVWHAPKLAEPHIHESGVSEVRVAKSVRVLPQQCCVVSVKLVGTNASQDMPMQLLLESAGLDNALQIEPTLLQFRADGTYDIPLDNCTGFTQTLEVGAILGTAVSVTDIVTPSSSETSTQPKVNQVLMSTEKISWRKRELCHLVDNSESGLLPSEREDLKLLLSNHHQVFSLEEGERGETDLTQFEINTVDTLPKKQPTRRIPYAAQQEVAQLLKEMQDANVIRPSTSAWASPIVLVKKKDGTLRFCVDYRALNKVTVADAFPLPKIDDLLDQLGKCRYFSTLDLKSGYWQIQVHPSSQAKTAFTTHKGLFEFRVMPFGLMNAPAAFQRLMQQILSTLDRDGSPNFVAVYLDDILIFSETFADHKYHIKQVLQKLEEVNLKLNPKKCHFGCQVVEYLGHILTPNGLQPNPERVTAVKHFATPTDVKTVKQFLGLASFYRKFVPNFAKIAEPLHALTRKGVEFEWSSACQESFNCLRQKLVESPVLAYPNFNKDFVLETDASICGLGAVLSQVQEDGCFHPISYASRALSVQERNYAITELETLAVVWAIGHFQKYLYGHSVTVYSDHAAVNAVLQSPNPSSKHARWWTKVFGSGIKDVQIIYRPGKENRNADALSRQPHASAPFEGIAEGELQVCSITSDTDMEVLLKAEPTAYVPVNFRDEQLQDSRLYEIIHFMETDELPGDRARARKVATQQSLFVILDGILYYLDKRSNRTRVAVPHHLKEKILMAEHRGVTGGHFSGKRTYSALAYRWWWEGMYSDAIKYAENCPECTIVTGMGRHNKPPLHPIPVSRPFQIIGVDLMELPKTRRGNKYVIVFQDYLTKWPLVYPLPDQRAVTIARVLVEEVIPFFGVPESLLSDRGTNLLSHLMQELCTMLGITKLNTTAYHPQCDGMVERFNRTLKSMLRKHASRFGNQWDNYLSMVLWAYRNTPHDSTGEKPSFLLFGTDLRSPTEAAYHNPNTLVPGTTENYKEEVMLALSSARSLAVESISKAQDRYKHYYDRNTVQSDFRVGDWIFIQFPAVETGRNRKLSHPWQGPYRVLQRNDPDITATKVYFPDDGQIQVHQQCVTKCPPEFIAGYYWYGPKKCSAGKIPQWVTTLCPIKPSTPSDTTVENTPVYEHVV